MGALLPAATQQGAGPKAARPEDGGEKCRGARGVARLGQRVVVLLGCRVLLVRGGRGAGRLGRRVIGLVAAALAATRGEAVALVDRDVDGRRDHGLGTGAGVAHGDIRHHVGGSVADRRDRIPLPSARRQGSRRVLESSGHGALFTDPAEGELRAA